MDTSTTSPLSPTDPPVSTQSFLRLTGPFGAVCEQLPPTAWDQPSPCEGWTAHDVLRHVMDTEREFLAPHGVDLPGSSLDQDGDPVAAWRSHAEVLTEALADPALGNREYDGYFGRTTVGDTLLRFYGFDLVVHRWDLARSAGLDERLTEEELDFVEACAAGYGDALHSEGVCRSGVEAPADADRQGQLLALLGRRA